MDTVGTAEQYKAEHPKLFVGLGHMQGDYTIRLREDATPFALSTPRRVSIPLLPVVEAELKKLEGLRVIRRVESPTDWCAGMVVVAKPKDTPSAVEGGASATHKVLNAIEREREARKK